MFNLNVITAAFVAADAEALAFDELTSEMVQWHESGEYPVRADVIVAITASGRKESTAKVYASRILAWAKAGKMPRSMHALVAEGPKATGKGGRPKGKGKGKTSETSETSETSGQTFIGLFAELGGYAHNVNKMPRGGNVAEGKEPGADGRARIADAMANLIAVIRMECGIK